MNETFDLDDELESEVTAVLRRTAAIAQNQPWDVRPEDFKTAKPGFGRGHWSGRRTAVVAVVAAMSIAAVVVPLALRSQPASTPSQTGPHLRPGSLVDTAATPKGWSPVAYYGLQLSVPSSWFIESRGSEICGGGAAGMVFVGRAVGFPTGMGCALKPNLVSMTAVSQRPPALDRTITVNGIAVGVSPTPDATPSRVEWAFGVEVVASGPLATMVLGTLTRSPLAVALSGLEAGAPAAWPEIAYGGLEFAVPDNWQQVQSPSWGGGCQYGIQADTVVLSSARYLGGMPSCPGPIATAGFFAARAGLLVGTGNFATQDVTPGKRCLDLHGLSACVEAGSATDGLLTLLVRWPGEDRRALVEIGLAGSGATSLEILDSIRPLPVEASECSPAHLSPRVAGEATRVKTETVLAIALTNTSSASCSLEGYPTITWELFINDKPPAKPNVTALQTDESLESFYGAGFVVSRGPQHPVVVAPGKSAMFYLALSRSNSGVTPACSDTIESGTVTLPGWSASVGLIPGALPPTCLWTPFAVSPIGLEGAAPFPAP